MGNSFGQAVPSVVPACAGAEGDWLDEEQLGRGTRGSAAFQSSMGDGGEL